LLFLNPNVGLPPQLVRHPSETMNWTRAIKRAVREPRMAFETASGLLRGHYYRIKFKLLGRRVEIGRFFRVSGPLDIRGPGRVVFGDHCTVVSSRLKPTTPYTHARTAEIRFGNRVLLTRTRIGCETRVEVSDNAGLAEAWIMDSDFHAVESAGQGPRYDTKGRSKPVFIGPNVWVGANAMILKGVRIGADSIVGAGAVVSSNVPPGVVVFGNPARVIWRMRRRDTPTAASETAGAKPTT
jgi:acetyltransferase-like isoleucine patch superfamily enzyme